MHSTLKNVEIAYLFAKRMNHGINKSRSDNRDWQLFEPSRFIYAFFSFNMLYDIHWERSIDKHRIILHPGDIKTGRKINHLTNFIHHYTDNVYTELSVLNYDKIINNSKAIKPDININRTDIYVLPRNSFLENYRFAMRSLGNKTLNADNHYRLLSFCNQIRNNIFHGAKTVNHMQMQDQRIRLIDYTNILLETMELLFQILEREIDYYRAGAHDLEENIIRL
jgi:hypothetical protein